MQREAAGHRGRRGTNALNLTLSVLGSVDVRGSNVVLICIPIARALDGKLLRNSLVARERREKGLNRVCTSVMKRVIMAGKRFVCMFCSPPGASGAD